MSEKVTPIEELTNEEINALYSGFDVGCLVNILGDEKLKESLQHKGYITYGENPDLTIKGKQITDKYWYESTVIILDELNKSNDINTVYNQVKGRINLSKPLFYTFIDNLVSIGKVTEISKYISSQKH